MPSLQEDADCRPPTSPATMDQYLSVEGDLLLGDTAHLPMLSMPLMPLPVADDVVPELSVGSPAGEPVVVPSVGMPDLSQEGPFDVHQDALESGATPQLLDSLPGCQYHMTSYDIVIVVRFPFWRLRCFYMLCIYVFGLIQGCFCSTSGYGVMFCHVLFVCWGPVS